MDQRKQEVSFDDLFSQGWKVRCEFAENWLVLELNEYRILYDPENQIIRSHYKNLRQI